MRDNLYRKREHLLPLALAVALLLHVGLISIAFVMARTYSRIKEAAAVLSVTVLPPPERRPPELPALPEAILNKIELPKDEPPHSTLEPELAPEFPGTPLALLSNPTFDAERSYDGKPEPQLESQLENAQAPVFALGRPLGFTKDDPFAKASIIGDSRAMVGKSSLSFLDLPPSSSAGPSFPRSAFIDNVCDYISTNTGVLVTPDAANVSLAGSSASFDAWIAAAKRHISAERANLTRKNLPVDALNAVGRAVATLASGHILPAQQRVFEVLKAYLSERYGIPVAGLDGNWLDSIEMRSSLTTWERQGIPIAKSSAVAFANSPTPKGTELGGLYHFLRLSEIMRYPILFVFWPQNEEIDVSSENGHLLLEYLNNGGFLYMIGCQSRLHAFIQGLFQEELRGNAGGITLERLQRSDRNPSGYEVHDPVPAIFEASTVFRFAIPEDAKVLFTVFDTSGQQRYSHTLRDIPAGDYLGASKAFTWNGTDSSGLPLPAGYYIYRFETGSFQQTGAVLKSPIRIRPLQVQDQVFSSFYPPDDFSIYNQPGFRGVTINERLSIVTEGGLMAFLAASDGSQRRKPAMKWFTNVCITALGKSSIARGGVKGAPDGGH